MEIAEVKFDGSDKFMWDGEVYESPAAAESRMKEYAEKGFETRMFEQEGKTLVYTRRAVKEIVLDGAPPA